MAAVDGLDQVIEQYRHSVDEVAKGNPEPQKELFSHREDRSKLIRPWSVSHRLSEMAISLTPRP